MEEVYKCEQIPIIVCVPDNTVSLCLNATVIDKNKKMLEVTNTMEIADLYEARVKGEEWADENVEYVINPDFEGDADD